MRLGLSSIVGDGFGTGSFGVDGSLTPPSFPPAGSYNSTQFGIDYPVAQGGSAVQDPALNLYPSQICDVDVLNDGSGGTYIDWSSVTNIQYKAYGISYYTSPSPSNSDIEVPSGSGVYYTAGSAYADYRHDGSGGYFQDWVNQTWYSNGTDTNIGSVNGGDQQTEVPSGSGNYYSNGQFDGYTWDGSGGYNFPVTKGAYYSNGTDTNLAGLDSPSYTDVPTGSGNNYANGRVYGYTWDGSGGYNYPVTKVAYYSNGTDTNLTPLDVPNQLEVPSGSGNYFNDGTSVGYTWDGTGGYNYPVTKGAYYSSGTVIFHYDNTVEVPSGSGQNFSNGTFQEYRWDGSGGYNDTSGGSYYSYGTYITNYSGVDYYWDGAGGYYT